MHTQIRVVATKHSLVLISYVDIYVDLYCLDHDGNVFDACLLALVSCLQDGTPVMRRCVHPCDGSLHAVRLPRAKLSADGTAVELVSEERPIALALKHTPVATSFAVMLQECVDRLARNRHSFPDSSDRHVIVDPTAEEEELSTGTISVVVNNKSAYSPHPVRTLTHSLDELCGLIKPGGTAVSEEQLKACVAQASERVPELLDLLSKARKSE